jgi:hypothetical protein
MTIENQIIKMNYSNINYINLYLFYIILGFSVYIIISLYSTIENRINPNPNAFTNSIDTVIGLKNFQAYLKNYLNKLISGEMDTLNNKIQNENLKFQEIEKDSVEFNKKLLNQHMNNTVNYQNIYIDSQMNIRLLKNTIEKINEVRLANTQYVKKMYDTYSQRISGYINNLFNVMNTLQYQINLAYITPSLNMTIEPIKGLYNSIYTILQNNAEYVKTNVTNFKLSDLKPITTKLNAVQDLSADFTKSSLIFQKLNY